MAFMDPETAFDQVPWKVIWWAMRKLGVEEWILKFVPGMYENVQSCIQVDEGLSDEFKVRVSVQQGSMPGPLLFVILLEALSREFRAFLSSRRLFYKTQGHAYNSCVRNVMHHASKTWLLISQDRHHLQRNDISMIRQICNVKPDRLQCSITNTFCWLNDYYF